MTRTRTATLLGVLLGLVAVLAAANMAAAATTGVCEPRADQVQADTPSVPVTAPPGYLITGWCVKAGSVQQGLGPEEVQLPTPVASAMITHSSGKDVSHYVLRLVPIPGTTVAPSTTVPEATTTAAPPSTTAAPPSTTGATTSTTVPEATSTAPPTTGEPPATTAPQATTAAPPATTTPAPPGTTPRETAPPPVPVDTLPRTGANGATTGAAIVGLVALGIGWALIIATRRRSRP